MAQSPAARRRIPAWLEVIVLVVVALVVSLAIKTFAMQMFFVPSESMEPLFVTNDRILVQKVSYWGNDVQRGDVVVFEDPGGWLGRSAELGPVQKGLSLVGLYPSGGHLVKRVIAVGGDRVTCCDKQGRVTVNDVPLDEGTYLMDGQQASVKKFDVRVPEDRLWVMGDNRANSEDSRYHQNLRGKGTIPVENVVGKVFAIVWPLGRFTFVDRPETFDQETLQRDPMKRR
jgi:signal peptidase I